MIEIKHGNIFDSECQCLVNTVNCEGIMGKGIALEFKNRYPEMFKAYRKWCIVDKPTGGSLLWWQDEITPDHDLFDNSWTPKEYGKTICNFATKEAWRNPSNIEWIKKGLERFVKDAEYIPVVSVAFPMLGCGNGKLDKKVVLPIMLEYLEKSNISLIEIYLD